MKKKTTLASLEKRVVELEADLEEIGKELGSVKQELLKALARAIHGPSQPPPSLPRPKEPG